MARRTHDDCCMKTNRQDSLGDIALEAAKRERQAKSRAQVRSGERSQESMFLISPAQAKVAIVRHRVLSFSDEIEKAEVRESHNLAGEQRRAKYEPIARALRDPVRAIEVVTLARQQVQLWRAKSLCSLDYIEAWDSLLMRPLDAAAILEEDSLYAAQLRQNAPFVAVLRKLKASPSI